MLFLFAPTNEVSRCVVVGSNIIIITATTTATTTTILILVFFERGERSVTMVCSQSLLPSRTNTTHSCQVEGDAQPTGNSATSPEGQDFFGHISLELMVCLVR